MKIPIPEQIGLPPKFTKWRSSQEEAIDLINRSQKRAVVICAPTGFGKSPVAVGSSLLAGEPTAIVTQSKGLQDQYFRDYKSIGMVDLRGRNNYICDLKPDYTCQEGYAARCPYKGTVGCPASQAEMRAATSSLVVTNYAKWTRSKMYGQGLSHITRVIFDEAHEVPEAIASAMQVTLNHKEIEEVLGKAFLVGPDAQEFANWKCWAVGARAIAEAKFIEARERVNQSHDPKPSWVKHFNHMRNLVRRLGTLSTANKSEWIVEEVDGGYQFDPIRPARYAESALFLRVPKIVFVSATIRPKTLYMSGVSKENFDFQEFNSDFDPSRSPIYHIPTMRVDARSGDLSLLWARLDQLFSKRQDRKGIVITTSYQYQKDVRQSSRFASNMLLNEKGEAPTELIDRFRKSGAGKILVSPSVGTGYDFPDDDCRYLAMLKIPFDPPSKILKAREADDKEYRSYRAMQKLVQNFGRPVRSKEDWAERVIFDNHCEWFIPRYAHLAPKSFHAFYKTVNTLPQPPKV